MATRIRKNSDKRKAKSRDAARVRRSTESEIFAEISCLLPIDSESIQQMDKISIVRLAVAYLQTESALTHSGCRQSMTTSTSPPRSLASAASSTSGSSSSLSSLTSALAGDFSSLMFLEKQQVSQAAVTSSNDSANRCLTNEDMESMIASMDENEGIGAVSAVLEGFLILLSGDGSIAFISEEADGLLGLNPLDLMGNSVYDYVHLCDHQELDFLIRTNDPSSGKSGPSSVKFKHKFIRVKNTLTARGKRVNLSQATYRVVRFSGKYLPNGMILGLMEILPNAGAIIDRFLGCQVIHSKHSLDMKFTHIDNLQAESILGFREADILGTSFYQYFHPLDAPVVQASLRDLYARGQAETPAYRFLARDGSYVWIVTQWTLVRDTPAAVALGQHHQPLLAPTITVTTPSCHSNSLHTHHNQSGGNVQHHFNQSQSNHILSLHFVISTDRSSNRSAEAAATSTSLRGEHTREEAADILLLLPESRAGVSQLTPASAAAPRPVPSIQGTFASPFSAQIAAASFLLADPAEKITATDSVFAPRTEDMSSGFLMLTGDEKSPLTIIHDSVIETDPAHDLTHLAPEVDDGDSFPLDLDNLTGFEGFAIEDLLSLQARDGDSPISTSTTDSALSPQLGCRTTATDSVFGCSGGSSPFSLDSRASAAEDYSNLQDVMSGGSANCSPFSLESDSSDQYSHAEDQHPNVMTDSGFVPFSLESLVSDVVVSSPSEEDPDVMMLPFCRSSSIGDSPPSSSRSFDCDSDLDLYSNCNADLGLFTDDTFLDSLLTSNLPDVISNTGAADDMLSSVHNSNCNDTAMTTATNGLQQMNSHLNSLSSANCSSRDFFLPSPSSTKLPPPLPLTSSLATLLQQKTIMSNPTSANSNSVSITANNNSKNHTSMSSGSSKKSMKGTVPGNSTHATNSHILVQNGQHFTIYKILAAAPSSGTAASGLGVGSTSGSITSSADVAMSQKGVTKRFLSGASSNLTPNKRMHLDSGSLSSCSAVHHPKPVSGNSVLMNLLVNGEDVRNGYTSRKSSSGCNIAAVRSRTAYSCPFD